MFKKNPLVFALFLCVLIYMGYKVIAFFILDSQITYDNTKPKIEMSEFVAISEKRVDYSRSFYINNEFSGFTGIIDKKYFISVTKLGKVNQGFKIVQTYKKPNNSSDINLLNNSETKNENASYIDLHNYPFNTKRIYYYTDGKVLKLNKSKFYEIETIFTFFNISIKDETRKDFGFVGFKKKNSLSFIEFKGDLFVLNLFPIDNNEFKSLHDLNNAGE